MCSARLCGCGFLQACCFVPSAGRASWCLCMLLAQRRASKLVIVLVVVRVHACFNCLLSKKEHTPHPPPPSQPPPTPLPACNFPMPSRPQASHSTSVSISHLLLLMTRFTTGLRVGEMFSSPLSSSQTSNCKSQIVYASRIPPRPRDDSMIGRRRAKEIDDLVG